jgi:hypothetical protein
MNKTEWFCTDRIKESGKTVVNYMDHIAGLVEKGKWNC